MNSVQEAFSPGLYRRLPVHHPSPNVHAPLRQGSVSLCHRAEGDPKFNASGDPEAGQTTVVGLDAGWRGRVRGGDCVHSGDSAGAIFLRHEAERGYRSRATSVARSRCTNGPSRLFLSNPSKRSNWVAVRIACKNSAPQPCFRTLILATVLASLSNGLPVHRNRRLGECKK
jgi:hypothetical protein